MRPKLLFFIFCCFIFSSFSSNSFHQISYLDPEFLEIQTNKSINFSSLEVRDENSGFNNLNLIQYKHSPYILVVGTKFLEKYNLTSLNCSIYSTSTTGPGKRGLKNSGETILLSSNYTNVSFEFSPKEKLLLKENQSVYPSNISNFKIRNISLCGEKLPQNKNPVLDFNITINSKTCEDKFFLRSKKEITEERIEFDFKTTAKNFTIEYWVEDYKGVVVKEKKNSTSLSKKSYTPKVKRSDIYISKARLLTNNCSYEESKTTFYYYLQKEKQNKTSFLEILNKKELEEGRTQTIEYFIYRGNTRKSAVYLYLDSKKVLTLKPEKNSKVNGRMSLELNGVKKVRFEGLDKKIELKLPFIKSTSKEKKTKSTLTFVPKVKDFFSLNDLKVINSTIHFNINTSLKLFDSFCYVRKQRKLISSQINVTSPGNIILNINVSKIKDQNKINLTLYCQYKKKNLKSYKYSSENFEYKLEEKSEQLTEINNSDLLSSSLKTYKEKSILKKTPQNNSISQTSSFSGYVTKQTKYRDNSYFPVFLGLVLISSALILKW